MRLNNMLAIPLTRQRAQNLGKAYFCFEQVNKLHKHTHGTPSTEATYNQACCFSLAAWAFFSGIVADTQGLPPSALVGQPSRAAELAEARLDIAIATLYHAVELGYNNLPTLLADEDLNAVRSRRPADFQGVLQRARTLLVQRSLNSDAAPRLEHVALDSSTNINTRPLVHT